MSFTHGQSSYQEVHDLITSKGHDAVVSLLAGDDMRPAEAK